MNNQNAGVSANAKTTFVGALGRKVCGIIGFYAALFTFVWGWSNIGALFSGHARDVGAAVVGLVFTAIAGSIAFFCIRIALGMNPDRYKPESTKVPLLNVAQMTREQTVKLAPKIILKYAAIFLVSIILAVVLLAAGGIKVKLVGAVFLLAAIGSPIIVLRAMLSGGVAFSYGFNGITVPGIFGAKTMAWRDVLAINFMKKTTYVYGFVPVRNDFFINIKVKGGLFGTKTSRLPTHLAGLDKEEIAALAVNLEKQRLYASGAPQKFASGADNGPYASQTSLPSKTPYVPAGSRPVNARRVGPVFGKRVM